MEKYCTVPPGFRYVLAFFTAAAVSSAGAGLTPAMAAAPGEKTVAIAVDDKTVTSETDAGAIGLTLPGTLTNQPQLSLTQVPEERLEASDETPLASTLLPDSGIGSYKTDAGVQTLIRIDSLEAAKEYRFPLRLPEGATAQLVEDGAVLIKDARGE